MQTLKLVKTGKVCESEVRYCSPEAVYDLISDMSRLDREHFVVLHLNGKNNIIARETVSIGSLQNSIVHPREVFRGAIYNASAAIILVHNHPSGDPTPSTDDKVITTRLSEVGALIGVDVLDHIIVGENRYYSFCGSGDLKYGKAPIPFIENPRPPLERSRKRSQKKADSKRSVVTE